MLFERDYDPKASKSFADIQCYPTRWTSLRVVLSNKMGKLFNTGNEDLNPRYRLPETLY